ncbi:MAG: ROK family protein [Crocosphaera sp.]|nr:ROK family protein [Crocosphaera sp.]
MSNKSKNLIVTIDVGGTGTKYNIYDRQTEKFILEDTRTDKEFQERFSNQPENEEAKTEFVNRLIELINDALEKANEQDETDYKLENIRGVGMCVPGQVEPNGDIKEIAIFKIENFNLKNELEKELTNRYNQHITCEVIHDVSMHTLGMYRALREKKPTVNISSLLVVSAGTGTGIGIRLEDINPRNNQYKLIYGSEFQFSANLLRGYGIKWSIDELQSIRTGNEERCPYIGWKTARKGIESTFRERIVEILESPTAIKLINGQNITNLYDEIMKENMQTLHLARRIFIEYLDSDNPDNYKTSSEEKIKERVENRFKEIVDNFRYSRFIREIELFKDIPMPIYEMKEIIKPIERKRALEIVPEKVKECKDIGKAADNDDKFALSVIDECAEILGHSLIMIIQIIQPSCLVLAGGVSNSDKWFNKVKETIETNITKEITIFRPQNIKPDSCRNTTEVQLLGAVELIEPINGR